jgi:hypothetical protein
MILAGIRSALNPCPKITGRLQYTPGLLKAPGAHDKAKPCPASVESSCEKSRASG